jgi:hypothetical protein
MSRERTPLGFFLNGAAALIALFGVTLAMESRPEVKALRAMITLGLGTVVLKVVLRYYKIDFPPRHRRPNRPAPPD